MAIKSQVNGLVVSITYHSPRQNNFTHKKLNIINKKKSLRISWKHTVPLRILLGQVHPAAGAGFSKGLPEWPHWGWGGGKSETGI